MAKQLQRMLRRRDVEDVTGLPRSTIYERMAAGKFPRPVYVDGAKSVRWLESEIIEWQAKQIAARDNERKRIEAKRHAA